MKNKRHTHGGETHDRKETAHTLKDAGRQNDHGNSTKPAAPELVGGAILAALFLLAGWLQIGGAA